VDIKVRRTALGWSRKELAEKAFVDPRTLQLLELGESNDDESRARIEKALAAEEAKRAQG
jgi:transcriptional regulator with XRE-family HTH domain